MPFFKVNKPKWVTSYDIVEKFKRIFFDKKVWHSGTLDPMASGLLIIAVWRDSTKHLGKFLWANKEYETIIDFSIFSDTRDLDYFDTFKKYDIVERNWKKWILINWNFVPAPTKEEIENKLKQLIPEAELPLTMFSAKKINWQKLYELARKWIDLNLKQKMKTNSFEIISYDFPKLHLKLNVWSGTYIRSIWYWLWQQFWLPGTLTMLKRTKIWDVEL